MNKLKLTTVAGIEVECNPISMQIVNDIEKSIREEYAERGEPIEIPKYKVDTVGGGEEWHEHDSTTLETAEDKKLWLLHLAAKDRMADEIKKVTTEYILREGLASVKLPESMDWYERRKKYHVRNMPDLDDKDALWMYYLTTELFKTPQDANEAVWIIMRSSLSGVDPEVIKSIEESFRNQTGVEVGKINTTGSTEGIQG